MSITLISIITIGIFGLILGSFYTVVIMRLPGGESLIVPRSHCPTCHHALRFYDLIPMLSFILLAGKCRYCRSPIPLLYPLIECITAIGFIVFYLHSLTMVDFLIGCGLFSLLMIVSVIDIKTFMIPDKVLFTFFAFFVVLHYMFFYPAGISRDLFGLLTGLVCPLLVWLYHRKGMGLGDIKLFCLLGFILGSKAVLACIIFSCLLGILFLLIMAAWKKSFDTRLIIPFAPFISAGAILVYFCGNSISQFF